MRMAMAEATHTGLVDRDGHPLELVLYKFDACPFCMRVQRVIDRLGIPRTALSYRDTWTDRGARDELIAIGGKSQVPCLLINGRPMYESRDIARFFEDEVRVL